MNTSLPLHNFDDVSRRSLAPVIPLRTVEPEHRSEQRMAVRKTAEKKLPLFYNKPIFKTKKYDLL